MKATCVDSLKQQEQKRNPYLLPLDGVRAVAILAVIVFHVWPIALKGGFTGVDVFFVLSGFLITSILLQDIHEGNFSIREFYLRRIQRLLPNLLVTVLFVLLLWALWMPSSATRQTGCHGLWTLFNLSNIYVWRELGGYWGDTAEAAPLTHTWSLGIEEQFYLVFPFFLLLVVKLQPARVHFWLIITAAISFAGCLYGSYSRPAATFYLLPTRVWELLLGAAIAAYRMSLRLRGNQNVAVFGVRARNTIGMAGLGLIILGFFMISEEYAFPGLVSLAPTVGTAFVLLSVTDGETRVSGLLSGPFMVKTGKLSYSLYLWHWPLITLGKSQAEFYGLPRLAGAVTGAIASILLACVAYTWIEQPLRVRGVGRSWRFAIIGVGLSLVALLSGILASRPLVADKKNYFNPPSFHIGLYDAGRNAGLDQAASSVAMYDVSFPRLPTRPVDAWRTGGVVHPYGGGRPKVVVLGSSHALMYSKLIDEICHQLGVSVAFLAVAHSTSAFFEASVNPNFPSAVEAHDFDDTRKKLLLQWRPETVFVIDRWDVRATTSQSFDLKLRSFLKEVTPLANRVVFVAQVPVVKVGFNVNLREFVTSRMSNAHDLPRLDVDLNEHLRKQAVATAEMATMDFPNLRVLRADLPFYQKDGSIRYASGRNFFYTNADHLSDVGSEEVKDLFLKAITEAHTRSSISPAATPLP